jgi:hypothetical protein
MEVSEAKRLRRSEKDNRQLKRTVAEQAVHIRALKGDGCKKVMSPQMRWKAITRPKTPWPS